MRKVDKLLIKNQNLNYMKNLKCHCGAIEAEINAPKNFDNY